MSPLMPPAAITTAAAAHERRRGRTLGMFVSGSVREGASLEVKGARLVHDKHGGFRVSVDEARLVP